MQRRCPEITWTIWSGDDEGKGYAREACEGYLAHAAGQLGFGQMLARVAEDNAPSRRLAERMGGVLDPDAVPPAHFPGSLTYAITLGVS